MSDETVRSLSRYYVVLPRNNEKKRGQTRQIWPRLLARSHGNLTQALSGRFFIFPGALNITPGHQVDSLPRDKHGCDDEICGENQR